MNDHKKQIIRKGFATGNAAIITKLLKVHWGLNRPRVKSDSPDLFDLAETIFNENENVT